MTYHFITRWQFRSPLERVWDEIYHSDDWPSWWKGVLSVERLRKGDPDGVGEQKRYAWKSILPYKLCFEMTLTENIPYSRLVGKATGELEGTGIWTFEAKDGITLVCYDWQVRTTKRWMNLLSPIARPFFEWNHDVVMEWGRRGLEQRLSGY